jgi:hypothetical protein
VGCRLVEIERTERPCIIIRYKHTHTSIYSPLWIILWAIGHLQQERGGSSSNGGRSVLTSSIAGCQQDAGEGTRPAGLVSYEPEGHLNRQGQDLYSRNNMRGMG